ncbi:MAG: hypothetical protein HQL75_14945 [Magnetococcales bacterium]|nr:hypothetical protein [Magnetococcales bacterium]
MWRIRENHGIGGHDATTRLKFQAPVMDETDRKETLVAALPFGPWRDSISLAWG